MYYKYAVGDKTQIWVLALLPLGSTTDYVDEPCNSSAKLPLSLAALSLLLNGDFNADGAAIGKRA